MSEIWVAAVGVAIAGTGLAMQMSAKPPDPGKPPKFKQIDFDETNAMATVADVGGYMKSDEEYKKRFPDLVKARDYMIGDIAGNVKGKVSKPITSSLARMGFGDVELGKTTFAQSKNLGRPITGMQDRSRDYFLQQMKANPQRQFGLTGQDAMNIAITNVGSGNNFNQGLYGLKLGQYQSGIQQQAQNVQGALSGIAGLASIGQGAYDWRRQQSVLDAGTLRNTSVTPVG